MDTLEGHYRDMCDIEFTIEKGQALDPADADRQAHGVRRMGDGLRHARRGSDRRGQGAAACRREPAGGAVQAARVEADGAGAIAKGLNASPGAATGRGGVQRRRGRALGEGRRRERVILVRRETTPDDYHGMIAVAGHPDQRRRDELARGGRRARRGHPGRLRRRRDQARHEATSVHARTARPCARATPSRSTGSPATCTWASCRLTDSRAGEGAAGRRGGAAGADLEGVRAADAGRRRPPAPAGAGERRHAGPVDERAGARRGGHRPVPDRAHVPGRGAGRSRCGR